MEPLAQEDEEQEHLRRSRALHDLASNSSSSANVPSLPTGDSTMLTRNPRDRVSHKRLLGSLLLVMLVVFAGVLAYLRFAGQPAGSTQPKIPATLTIAVQAGTVSCPSALAWSPNGARLAVLAQRGGCGASSPDTLLIYDTVHGTQLATIDLSDVLAQARAAIINPTLSWSPDEKLLAAPVLLPGSNPSSPGLSGLLLIPVQGGTPHIFPSSSVQPGSAATWNTQTGASAASLPLPLAPAISYRWTTDGQIAPEQLFPPADSSGFTGSPVAQPGSATFPLWQSGAIISIYPTLTTPRVGVLPAYYFVVEGSIWSPQEQQARYVAPYVTLGPWPLRGTPDSLKQMAPKDCSKLGWLPLCGAALLPMPDRAFAQIAQRITGLSSEDLTTLAQGNLLVPLAWNPNGKLLATMLPGDAFSPAHDTVKVSLLSTATGQVVRIISAPTHSSGPLNPLPPPFSWSPSGQQLAFMDSSASQITIWGGASLPR